MKILLTGATGYIGKRLLPVLVEAGHHVVCCVGSLRIYHGRLHFLLMTPKYSTEEMFRKGFWCFSTCFTEFIHNKKNRHTCDKHKYGGEYILYNRALKKKAD